MNRSKKIAVISVFDHLNYGNNLQRYAVQNAIRKRGLEPVSLCVRSHPLLGKVKDRVTSPNSDRLRSRNFLQFQCENRIAVRDCKPQHLIQYVSEGFAGAVIGSDQVWNPLYGLGSRKDGLACLEGVPSARKITLCPSFGITFEDMPDDRRSLYSNWLADFYRISVREDSGADIVRRLTGKDAQVLIDPTMGVTADEWRRLADYSVCPKGDYILTYYLGDGDSSLTQAVAKKAENEGVGIVNLMDKSSDLYTHGPGAFIALIDKALFVVTDSFHGSAFSLMLHTDFAVVQRAQQGMSNMLSRVQTLCSKFECSDRFVEYDAPVLPNIGLDWGSFEVRLKQERKAYNEFLDAELTRICSSMML